MADSSVAFGYLLPTRELVMAHDPPDFQRVIGLAERAEALGYDSVWAGDSILARPRLEALTTLAAIASRTQRVKLGTAVLLPALRHPVVLANEAANLDLMSQGRLILGVGIASKNPAIQREFAACGVSFARRVSLYEEGLTIMRRLWTEPEVSFTGQHFKLEGVSLGLRPVQKAGIPLWMAGSVDDARRRLLRLGDGWFPNPPSAQEFADGWERIETLAQESGESAERIHRCVYTTLNINEDVAQADSEMRAFVEGYYGNPYEAMARTQSLCAGGAERCANWLSDYVAAGAQTVVIRFGGPDQMDQLQRCAKEVLPNVRFA